jgi:hypothetical protein
MVSWLGRIEVEKGVFGGDAEKLREMLFEKWSLKKRVGETDNMVFGVMSMVYT